MAARESSYLGVPGRHMRHMRPTQKHRPAIWECMLGKVMQPSWRDLPTITVYQGTSLSNWAKIEAGGILQVSQEGHTKGWSFFTTGRSHAWVYSRMGGEVRYIKEGDLLPDHERCVLELEVPVGWLVPESHFLKTREAWDRVQEALIEDPGFADYLDRQGGDLKTERNIPAGRIRRVYVATDFKGYKMKKTVFYSVDVPSYDQEAVQGAAQFRSRIEAHQAAIKDLEAQREGLSRGEKGKLTRKINEIKRTVEFLQKTLDTLDVPYPVAPSAVIEQVVGFIQSQEKHYQEKQDEFLRLFTTDPIQAIKWKAEDVVAAQKVVQRLQPFRKWLEWYEWYGEEGPSWTEAVTRLVEHANDIRNDVYDRLDNPSSASQWFNVVEATQQMAEVKLVQSWGWRTITSMITYAIRMTPHVVAWEALREAELKHA